MDITHSKDVTNGVVIRGIPSVVAAPGLVAVHHIWPLPAAAAAAECGRKVQGFKLSLQLLQPPLCRSAALLLALVPARPAIAAALTTGLPLLLPGYQIPFP
jgi:hypothetical protein